MCDINEIKKLKTKIVEYIFKKKYPEEFARRGIDNRSICYFSHAKDEIYIKLNMLVRYDPYLIYTYDYHIGLPDVINIKQIDPYYNSEIYTTCYFSICNSPRNINYFSVDWFRCMCGKSSCTYFINKYRNKHIQCVRKQKKKYIVTKQNNNYNNKTNRITYNKKSNRYIKQ
jgi:hypothetical protein